MKKQGRLGYACRQAFLRSVVDLTDGQHGPQRIPGRNALPDAARRTTRAARPERHPRNYNYRVERKLATVLFVDLVGSTEFVAASDPEIVRRRVNSFFEHVSHCITTHGGIVEKFAGDAVMAAFGIPQAHEDDAERAIRAAAGILDSVHGLGLEARIGVEAGEVVADESDSTFATGEAVNVAARLQQMAQPGEILVGPFARRLTIGAVETEEVGPVALKGFGEPLIAWRLVQLLETDGRVVSVAAPFVGREYELELLENTLGRVIRNDRAHLFTIYGEPGVGKSRLAREFIEGVEGASVLVGRSLPYGEGVTYWPLAEMVKVAAGIADDDPVQEAISKLRAQLRRRRGRRPARARRRRARGDRDRAEPAGDCVGGARVGGRARRRAAVDPRLRGRPLGRGAAAGADRAPRRARQGVAADDPLPRAPRAARHPSRLGRWPAARCRDRARAARPGGERGAARRAPRRP